MRATAKVTEWELVDLAALLIQIALLQKVRSKYHKVKQVLDNSAALFAFPKPGSSVAKPPIKIYNLSYVRMLIGRI